MTTIGPPGRRSRVVHPRAGLRLCGGVFMALAWLAVCAAQAQTLGTSTLLVGPAAGTNSVLLDITGAWTGAANANWLQLSSANSAGAGNANVIFTFTANTNSTRSGTLTIAGQTLTVMQAGSNYVAAEPVTTLASNNLNEPYGVAVDGAGNVYIADTYNSEIKEWSAANGVTTLVSTNLSYPVGVAVDGAGNVYIADTDHSQIKKWSAAGGLTTLVSSGLSYPYGVAVDGAGDVYIADTENNEIKKWSVAGGLTTLVSNGLSYPSGVAVDGAGNVYIADTDHSAIKKWSAGQSNPATLVSNGLAYPSGVAVDGAGNVYIADTYNSALKEWTAANSNVTTLVSNGLFYPYGVAVDGAANFYVADTLDNAIKEQPYAFVATNNIVESDAAGSDVLRAVLNPPTPSLLAPFAPVSENTNWLAINGVTNGVVSFSFSNNIAGSNRMGGILLLGRSISVTQIVPPPQAITQPATAVTSNSATLNALITPGGAAATVYFAYGTNANYGNSTAGTNLAGGTNAIYVSSSVSGLLPATVYHFEAIASNSTGTVSGGDLTFTNNNAGTSPLATTSLVEGPAAGTDSVVVSFTTVGTNNSTNNWLHLSAANQSVPGGTNVAFSYDANTNVTRSGTLTIAGQTLTVTQAGANYVATVAATPLVSLNLSNPYGVAVDGAGNVYIADSGNNAIKEWTAANNSVITLVSSGLNNPYGVAVDGAGNVYIADSGNNAIKEWIKASGSVTNLVSSNLSYPSGVAVDGSGNVYIADTENSAIKEWSPGQTNPVTLVSSNLSYPSGVAVDDAGNVYIADTKNSAIKEWTKSNGRVITLLSSNLDNPFGVAVDGSGNVYIADTFNDAIKKWTAATGGVTNLVSVNTGAPLSYPEGVAVDGSGNVYLADTGSNAVEELPRAFVNASGRTEGDAAGADELPVVLPATENLLAPFAPVSSTNWLTLSLPVTNGVVDFSFAVNTTASRTATITLLGQIIAITQGGPVFSLGTTNLLEGPAAGSNSVVLAVNPNFGTWTATANATWLHLATANQSGAGSANVVFSFDPNPGLTRAGTLTIAGQTLTVIQAGSTYVAAGSLTALLSSNLNNPVGLAVDGAGDVYIADSGGNAIMEWTPSGAVSTTLVSSNLNNPHGVAVDANGNVYIADSGHNAIKEWTKSNGTVIALVSSNLNNPLGVAVDGAGNVYIADTFNNAVKEWTPANSNVTVLVSSGLFFPSGTAVDAAGNVYIADSGHNAIKKWTAANSNITTLAPLNLNNPLGVAVDGSGNVYIADTGDSAIKKWTAANGNTATLASGLAGPSGVAVDGAGNVCLADTGSNVIAELPYAFVDPTTKYESNGAGSDQLPAVLPAAVNLSGPFTPGSDANWLVVSLPVVNGVVSFSFSNNPAASNRVSEIALLGQTIPVTQGTNATPPALGNLRMLANGVFQFSFTNNPNASYTVLSTTNLALPLSQWTAAANTLAFTNGVIQFTSPPATNAAPLFYVIRSP
jgi:DNA-binding beta-propeller fold protein YncE